MNSQSKIAIGLTFAMYRNDQFIRRDAVTGNIIKVGTDPRSHIRIDEACSARMQAAIEVISEDDITWIDLGGEPGTLINDEPVTRQKIRRGDRMKIGETIIVLESIQSVDRRESEAIQSRRSLAAAGPRVASKAIMGDGYSYSMVRSSPHVSDDEVEDSHFAAIEVVALWETQVLQVTHLSPPRSYFVGEDTLGKAACDQFVPSDILGVDRAPIVLARGQSIFLIILPRSRGTVELPGACHVSFSDLIASGRAVPSPDVNGAYEIELSDTSNAKIEFEGSSLAFQVAPVRAGRRIPVRSFVRSDPDAFLYTGLSVLLHAGLLAVFAFFLPTMHGDESEGVDRDRILMMQKLLNAAADREQEERAISETATAEQNGRDGGTGTNAMNESGPLGMVAATNSRHRYGVQGPKDNPDPHLARQAALGEAAEFGEFFRSATIGSTDPNAPTATWGRDDSLGRDDKNARGNMYDSVIGNSIGAGGLALSGAGEGGGGIGEGIGLGDFGGLGQGAGAGVGAGIGNGSGVASGRGLPVSGHVSKAPRVRCSGSDGGCSAIVTGRLPPEVIQRIVRQNFGRFRLCYENGSRSNPGLSGRVSVKFVIDRSGGVSMASDSGSDLPDKGVVQCVVRGFGNLSFPQPEGGLVTVVYPIMFEPGE